MYDSGKKMNWLNLMYKQWKALLSKRKMIDYQCKIYKAEVDKDTGFKEESISRKNILLMASLELG